MPDITMTQILGATHHYRALIDVDPAKLQPTLDLLFFKDVLGNVQRTVDAIVQDPQLEANIEAEFEAQTTAVKYCKFVPDSLTKIVSPSGHIIDMFIKLDITTLALAVEVGAIEMKFEFLHTGMR